MYLTLIILAYFSLQRINPQNGMKNTKVLGFGDKFYNHGSREEVLEMAGLSPSHIKKAVKECSNFSLA